MRATRVRILITDAGEAPRFSTGELGIELRNDYPEKYEFLVLLDGTEEGGVPWEPASLRPVPRIYYFRAGEAERIGTVDTSEIEIAEGVTFQA